MGGIVNQVSKGLGGVGKQLGVVTGLDRVAKDGQAALKRFDNDVNNFNTRNPGIVEGGLTLGLGGVAGATLGGLAGIGPLKGLGGLGGLGGNKGGAQINPDFNRSFGTGASTLQGGNITFDPRIQELQDAGLLTQGSAEQSLGGINQNLRNLSGQVGSLQGQTLQDRIALTGTINDLGAFGQLAGGEVSNINANDRLLNQNLQSLGQQQGQISGVSNRLNQNIDQLSQNISGLGDSRGQISDISSALTQQQQDLSGNRNAFINARVNPLRQSLASREGDLRRSLQRRGVSGSFANQDISNLNIEGNRAINDETARALQDSITAQNAISQQQSGLVGQDVGIQGQQQGVIGQQANVLNQQSGLIQQGQGNLGQQQSVIGQQGGNIKNRLSVLGQQAGLTQAQQSGLGQRAGLTQQQAGILGQQTGIEQQQAGITGQIGSLGQARTAQGNAQFQQQLAALGLTSEQYARLLSIQASSIQPRQKNALGGALGGALGAGLGNALIPGLGGVLGGSLGSSLGGSL